MKKFSLSKLGLILMFFVIIFAIPGCSETSEEKIEDKKVVPKKEIEKLNEFKEEVKTEDIEMKEVVLSKEDEELQKIKILKVGKYEIDTTKQNPYIKVEVNRYREKFLQDGEEVYGTFHEYLTYSKNKKYVAIIYLKEGDGEYSKWTYLEIYEGIEEKKIIQTMFLPKGRMIEECQILSDDYILLSTGDFGGNNLLEIYNIKGEKIFETSLKDRYYFISPNEKYIFITEYEDTKETYKIFKYDVKNNLFKLIDKIKYEGKVYFYLSMTSKDGKDFIVKNFIDKDKIKLFLYRDSILSWEKEYTRKDLQVGELGPWFTFSKTNKYILYGYGIIDAQNGNLIKSGISKEEFKKYQEEK